MTSVMPPSVSITNNVGPQLTALGATVKDAPDYSRAIVQFPTTEGAAVANAAFESAINGVSVLYTGPTGAPATTTGSYSGILNAIAVLPGVKDVAALETFPAQITVIAKHESANAIDALLRDETVGEGHSILAVDEAAIQS